MSTSKRIFYRPSEVEPELAEANGLYPGMPHEQVRDWIVRGAR